MSKQTAVQWLIHTMENSGRMGQSSVEDVFTQALQMERKQIEEAFNQGEENADFIIFDDSKDYYTQTFKPQTK